MPPAPTRSGSLSRSVKSERAPLASRAWGKGRSGSSESAVIILSPVAMDEMFELFDNKLLITDNTFHHVANRNYTD